MQLWNRKRLYSALGRTNLRTLDGVDAIGAVSAQLSRDGAGRRPKVPSNLSHCELMKMEAGKNCALFRLDLFVMIAWSNLHLRILQS